IAIPEQIKGVLSNLSIIASPKFAKRSLREIQASLKKKFFLLFLIGCAVVGSYIIAAPFIFHAFFPKYNDSIFYSQLFVVSMLNMTFTISGTALTAQRRIKEQYIFNIAIPFIKVVLMTTLILWSGLIGLIIARIITRFADGILSAILLYAAKEEQSITGSNIQSQ
ncbi:hypothetical protein KGQ34_04375, partial [Patescibacteria group bacterium]|nr:hypothetical protein [Patescibacteria group bacterium]